VLSGGGAKGIAHIGVLKILEEQGIKPDIVLGTSMGALIGGLYSIGYSPVELEKMIGEFDWEYLLNDKIKRKNILIGHGEKDKKTIFSLPLEGLKPMISSGLYSGQNVLTLLDILSYKYNHKMSFDSLQIPFRCIATNIETGKPKVFDYGKLSEAMRASMSIPSVFSPYEIDGELYVDGGLVNNFPTDIARKMGADIVIGVDVGAVLYKKEEINSIIKILDQSASFYNYRVAQKNKKLCDIYIRPDISQVETMDFNKSDKIVKLGVDAAKKVLPEIKRIFGKYNLKPIPADKDTISFLTIKIPVSDIDVNTNIKSKFNQKQAKGLVMGKLRITPPDTISAYDLDLRFNKLFGTKFFENISLSFLKQNNDSYKLKVDAIERRVNDFGIGVRYDQTYGINLLISTQFRNLLLYGSFLEMSLVAGQSPQLRIRYTTDRGKSLGFGTSFMFNNFYVYTYDENAVKKTTYNYNRAVWDLFVHSYIGDYNRIILGAEASMFGLSSTQSISDINDFTKPYYSGFLAYIVDSWDKAYFPTKGIKMKIRADIIVDERGNILPHAWGKLDKVLSVSKKIKLIAEGFIGMSHVGLDTTLYRYETGGMENNRIEWYNSFPGLRFLQHGATNVWIAKISPRYEFMKNNYLTFTFAVEALEKDPELLFTNASEMYTGMQLKYSFSSMLGPLELSTDYLFNTTDYHLFLSLGYWF
jgi:NTE family protein